MHLQEESLAACLQLGLEDPFILAIAVVQTLLKPSQLECELGAQLLQANLFRITEYIACKWGHEHTVAFDGFTNTYGDDAQR